MITQIKDRITPIIIIGVILSFICVIKSFAQQEETEQIIENIAEQSETEFENAALLEQLDYYKENPLNINKATQEQLLQFSLLSEIQINSLLRHIEKNGELIAIYELQSVDNFDMETIQRISPFIKIQGQAEDYQVPFKDLIFKGQNQFFTRYQQTLEKSSGYIPDTLADGTLKKKYLGSPFKIYTRYRHSYGSKISYGITAEKDQGEEFIGDSSFSNKNGFDFYSAHFFVHDVGIFKYIALGDYEIKFGQGLIAYQGVSFGKSPLVMNIKKGTQFLRQYTSTLETNFMRGAGATAAFNDFYLTGFVSYRGTDANVSATDTSDNDEVRAVSSLLDDGYHRTQSELENKNSIQQTIYGGNFTFQKKNYHIGITAMQTQLSAPLVKTIYPYNQFEFSGQSLFNAGMDYNYLFQNFNFFGEIAGSDNGGMATLNGVLVSVDPKVDVSVLHRYFQKNYHTLFGQSFQEGTRPINETGTYFGLSIRPKRAWRIDAYFDTYKFPWLKYQINAPSDGYDALLQITYKPNKVMEMYSRVKYETKSSNAPSGENPLPIDYLVYNCKTNLRYHISYKVSKSFTLKSRVETIIYNDGVNENKYGYIVYQDVYWKMLSSPLSFSTRFALFDTDDYDTRIYTYEDDVLYAFSIPAFYNKGTRFYLCAKYKVIKGIDLEVRFAQTYYSNMDVISSGNDEIKGNTKSEVKAQLRWMF